ncbi:MAG: ankyrin repeat domain-containing protein [Vicinamibacterales bacterium]
MSVSRRAWPAIVMAALLAASCTRPPFGGDKESALVLATVARDVAKVQSLLDSGADPNRMVPYEGLNQSSWRMALNQLRPKSKQEDLAIITAMLKAGADPASAWGEGVSNGITRQHPNEPLLIVMLHPDAAVVRALLDAGLKSRFGEAALVMAVEGGETEIAHLLVEAGVDVNGMHGAAETPLLAAIQVRDKEMMAYLEAHGARERP